MKIEAIGGKEKEDYDIYLARNLYPVLLPAVEALSKEYQRQMEDRTAVRRAD